MTLTGRRLAGGMATLAVALAAPAVVFACSQIEEIQTGITYGPALSRTMVTVTGFREAPVEVHWNSVNGPLLATAVPSLADPTPAVPMTVPASRPGVYYLYAVQNTKDVHYQAVTTFEVSGVGSKQVDVLRPLGSQGAYDSAAHTFGGSTSPVLVGVLALSVGMVVMAAGVGVVELRRQRARSGGGRS